MTEASEKMPFAVDISRMIEVLAAQIYPTPFALLRENVQNSFDAILLRKHLGQVFEPQIIVTIEPDRVRVVDNGIGMSRDDLRNHFWRAGSSSKNTDDARAAGVVGTFGIGAMANFGIAEELRVETESAITNERTASAAARSTLSVTEDCITVESMASANMPGTSVTASMQDGKTINVDEAENYIAQFVAHLSIEVLVNGTKASGQPIEEAVATLVRTWSGSEEGYDLGNGMIADIDITGAINGDIRVVLSNFNIGEKSVEGRMVLRQGIGSLRTFRSGFGLATTSVVSLYGLGGVADFLFLQPTAGREALNRDSMQILQKIISRVDEVVSVRLAERPESNASAPFVNWAKKRGRFDLCGNLRVRIEPGESMPLHEVRSLSQETAVLVYSGRDGATVEHASEDRPIIMLTRGSPRRDCEINYLRQHCRIKELSDDPKVLRQKKEIETSGAEKALAFRLASILLTDYFLETHIKFGTISHGLPVLITRNKPPVEVFIDTEGPTAKMILEVYDKEYAGFAHLAKDFVRNMIFPRVKDLVPSAMRQSAEAFLKSINRTREIFEYEASDLESLTSLWQDYMSGKVTFQQATRRSERVAIRSYQVVDRGVAGAVRDVVPDVIDNQTATAESSASEYGPLPPIERLDMKTDKKLLMIEGNEPALKGYRCFLALTNRIREEKADFFLQPHRTSVVWGGQKALFIFEHHSGEFGLYYDLQTQGVISGQSGGGTFESCTIVMKNRIFIPIPLSIQKSFLPGESEKKRFEVRCDILHIDYPLDKAS